MMRKTSRALGQLCMGVALLGMVGGVSFAAPVPAGTPILIVDGFGDPDTTVTPTIVNIFPGYTFGQVIGGMFSEIISDTTALAGGSLVDFAIQEIGTPTNVYSLTDSAPTVVTANLSGPTLSGGEQVPTLVGDYFNTLDLQWTIGTNLFNVQVLNASAISNDGFAAVPIPAAALLFGTGLAGLVGIARRKGLLEQK